MPGFPTNPETLTTDWLSATLNTPIDDFRVEHFSESSGIIGTLPSRTRAATPIRRSVTAYWKDTS